MTENLNCDEFLERLEKLVVALCVKCVCVVHRVNLAASNFHLALFGHSINSRAPQTKTICVSHRVRLASLLHLMRGEK